jgi:hypothetical protein
VVLGWLVVSSDGVRNAVGKRHLDRLAHMGIVAGIVALHYSRKEMMRDFVPIAVEKSIVDLENMQKMRMKLGLVSSGLSVCNAKNDK